jgi:hypothetical protein
MVPDISDFEVIPSIKKFIPGSTRPQTSVVSSTAT